MIQSTALSFTLTGAGFETRARSLTPRGAQAGSSGSASSADAGSATNASPAKVKALTPQEQQQVRQLKQIDRLVRAHEQAHLAAGSDLVRGGATFSYQTGPDQQRYAVAGEVLIDASPARTPQETIPKAQHIRAAALAPADPSTQDSSVAAQAGRMESEARMEVAAQRATEQRNTRFDEGAEPSRALGRRLDLFA